ncbi:hypothetical protein [Tenacibaculum finnmarkense]|uniref:hypothetical protein n=1 Tax=Tenacibaculum finnmarkense TaxID=2781243 RepID=UPI00187B47CD|nr:hypothetical protein [Tenacibaculum finnmarkense]MBE7649251.1 hypothetical protein [Tenacibaculum finnmarkense genomovar ulcerans]
MGQLKKTCTCGSEQSSTCRNCSAIKMVIMLKNNQNHLKKLGPNGKLISPVWYSYVKSNGKTIDQLIAIMKRRFLNSKYYSATNKVIFYDNQNKQLIQGYKC